MLVFYILLVVGASSAIEDFHKLGDDAKMFSRLDSLFSPSRLPSFQPSPTLRVFHKAPWDLPSKPRLSFPLIPGTRRNSGFFGSGNPFKTPFSAFSDHPFPHSSNVGPFLTFKNTKKSNIWEDFFDTTQTHEQDQDWENFDDEAWQHFTEASTNPPRQDVFNHEFSFKFHGDPFDTVADHVNTFHKDLFHHVSASVSPLLNLFNKILDSAINVDVNGPATSKEDQEQMDEFVKNHHSEILDPNVIEHTGLPTPNIDSDLNEEFDILDPNVEFHMGLPNTDLNEDMNEELENSPTEVLNSSPQETNLDIVDIDQVDPVFDEDSERLASGVVEHSGIEDLMEETDLYENNEKDLDIVDIDQVAPVFGTETEKDQEPFVDIGKEDPEVDLNVDEDSESLASGVAEHTGINDLMALLDDIQDDIRDESPQTKESAEETQPEGFEYKTQNMEGSNADSKIPAFYSAEPIIHLIP